MSFKLQSDVCHGYLDLIQKAMYFNDVAIVSDNGNTYIVHFLIYECS